MANLKKNSSVRVGGISDFIFGQCKSSRSYVMAFIFYVIMILGPWDNSSWFDIVRIVCITESGNSYLLINKSLFTA